MIKDCAGRSLDSQVIEVAKTQPGLDRPGRLDIMQARYYTCDELFRDHYSCDCTLPSNMAEQLNSNYFSWQKICNLGSGWESYYDSYSEYDHGIATDIWVKFIRNKETFIRECDNLKQLSPDLRDEILFGMGFLYCGMRTSTICLMDSRDTTIENPRWEIYVNPKGFIVYYCVADNFYWFNDAKGLARFKGSKRNFYDCSSDICIFTEGRIFNSDGMTVHYPSITASILKSRISDKRIIPRWGQGKECLTYIDAIFDEELKRFKDEPAFFRQVIEDLYRIVKMSPQMLEVCGCY